MKSLLVLGLAILSSAASPVLAQATAQPRQQHEMPAPGPTADKAPPGSCDDKMPQMMMMQMSQMSQMMQMMQMMQQNQGMGMQRPAPDGSTPKDHEHKPQGDK